MNRRMTQEERRNETRQALLGAAVELFAQMGFHGASIDKISEKAGYSKGAFYAHFDSKENLFLILLQQQMEGYVHDIESILNQQESIEDFVAAMNHYYEQRKFLEQSSCLLNIEFLLYAMRDPSVKEKWSDLIQASVDQIASGIEKLLGSVHPSKELTPEELAWAILSLENGITIYSFIRQDQVPYRLYEKTLKDLLIC